MVDAAGNVYLAGRTAFSVLDFDAFVVKFNTAGVEQWVNYYAGQGFDIATNCAIDATGNVYLAGEFETLAGDSDAFLLTHVTQKTN